MKYSPDALAVRKLDWDFFVTLTHKTERSRWDSPSQKRQAHRFAAWVYRVCRSFRIKPRNFIWVRRCEVGRGGRDHFHVLIRLPARLRSNIRTTRYRLKNIWETKLGYGIADVRAVKANEGVSGYIAKKASEYEEARFSNERYRSVVFSRAALNLLKCCS